METTTKQIVILENSKFHLLKHSGKEEIDTSEIAKLKGYDLFISDSEMFYTSLEFPDAPKRKLHMFIGNYLLGSFPAEMCENFCYLKKGDNILIALFKPEFNKFFSENKKIFQRASIVTSPFANLFAKRDNFDYGISGLAVTDSIIEHSETEDSEKPDYLTSSNSRLNIPFMKSHSSDFDMLKIPAAILLVCYLLFVTGEYFRLSGVQKVEQSAKTALEDIYRSAKVDDKKDPYGHLLFLAKGKSGSDRYKSLNLLEKMSKAQTDGITTNSIEIKNNNVSTSGRAKDFSQLESYKNSLSKVINSNVKIIDTKQEAGEIKFSLRFQI